MFVPATGPVPSECGWADGTSDGRLLRVPPPLGRHSLVPGLGPLLFPPLVLRQVPGLGPPLGLGVTTPGMGSTGTVMGVPGPLPCWLLMARVLGLLPC